MYTDHSEMTHTALLSLDFCIELKRMSGKNGACSDISNKTNGNYLTGITPVSFADSKRSWSGSKIHRSRNL